MRRLFSIIGYLSTGTIIAIALGLGYLWQTRMLNNEKMFRMVAMLHDVDLQSINQEQQQLEEQQVPPEEVSLDERALMREVKLRDHEVKINALKAGTQEFERSLRNVNEGRKRFDQMAQELEERLEQQKRLSSQENLSAVVDHLQALKPPEAKELLLMFLEEPNGERDVITLMKSMQRNKLQKILQQFQTPEELAELHNLQTLMLDGFPEGPEIDNMLERVRMLDDNQ